MYQKKITFTLQSESDNQLLKVATRLREYIDRINEINKEDKDKYVNIQKFEEHIAKI